MGYQTTFYTRLSPGWLWKLFFTFGAHLCSGNHSSGENNKKDSALGGGLGGDLGCKLPNLSLGLVPAIITTLRFCFSIMNMNFRNLFVFLGGECPTSGLTRRGSPENTIFLAMAQVLLAPHRPAIQRWQCVCSHCFQLTCFLSSAKGVQVLTGKLLLVSPQ